MISAICAVFLILLLMAAQNFLAFFPQDQSGHPEFREISEREYLVYQYRHTFDNRDPEALEKLVRGYLDRGDEVSADTFLTVGEKQLNITGAADLRKRLSEEYPEAGRLKHE